LHALESFKQESAKLCKQAWLKLLLITLYKLYKQWLNKNYHSLCAGFKYCYSKQGSSQDISTFYCDDPYYGGTVKWITCLLLFAEF